MAVLTCKACGAPLNVKDNAQIAECDYCGLQQTIPQVDDEFKLQMFNKANELRRQFDFDGAKSFLQAIVAQCPEEAEAYWQICLCKYGVMYVEDQQTLTQIPTFYRMIPQSILADEDYHKACKYAGIFSWKYEEEAQKIEKLQKKILELSDSESPYDVFICYKKTDLDTGAQTEDSRIAGQIYMKLIENDYRVFWAERSLPAGCEYEPYIYAALSSAKIMLILSSDKSYFEAPWVKNEWVRYLDMMSRDTGKTIITCYKNLSPDDIPTNLKRLQALDMRSMLFSSDLLERIQKKIPKKNELDTESLLHAFKKFQETNQSQENSSAQKKEFTFDNGVYSGEAIAEKPHGYGIYHDVSGGKYEGNWNVGKKQGQGTLHYQNGDSWTGEWNNDMPWNGSGMYYFKDDKTRVCYAGVLKNGALSGEGKIYINGKLSKEGFFQNGKLHGNGTAYSDAGTCSGKFRDGQPWNATGAFFLPIKRKAFFNGPWLNGRPNGSGTVLFTETPERITGTFHDGLTGTVCWYFPNGRRYEGSIVRGALSGKGKMFSKSGGLIYEGNYSNNQPNGQGIHYVNNSERYEGAFQNDKYHGQGTYYYAHGSWTGEWREGRRWTGQGMIFYYKDGKQTGRFFNGRLVAGKAEGTGVFRHEDGSRFNGEFLDDKYYNGTVYNAQNQVIDTYVNGESQKKKAQERNEVIAKTALGIFKGLSGF